MKTQLTEKNTLSTNTLKLWAIIAMVCDHFPYLTEAWVANYYSAPWFLLHAFGRFTAPIFFYLLAVGYRRTGNANRYTLRLLVFAAISYVPYIWYFENAKPGTQAFLDNALELNVIFTMLFGLLLLRAIHEAPNGVLKGIFIVLCLIGGYWCDYGLYGLAVILVCDVARDSRRATVLLMGVAMMVYVYMRSSGWIPDGALPFDSIAGIFQPGSWKFGALVVFLCQLLPLILIARHRGWASGGAEKRPGFLAKWGFYIFYPAHITVLLLIRLWGF